MWQTICYILVRWHLNLILGSTQHVQVTAAGHAWGTYLILEEHVVEWWVIDTRILCEWRREHCMFITRERRRRSYLQYILVQPAGDVWWRERSGLRKYSRRIKSIHSILMFLGSAELGIGYWHSQQWSSLPIRARALIRILAGVSGHLFTAPF